MIRALSITCCLAVCSLPALAQKAPMSDQKFVDFAAQTDMVEAHVGDLAQNVAQSQAVKDYGQMLTADHTQDYQQLQTVAQQAGLTVPTAIDAEHNKSMIGPYHKLKGPGFDKKFAHDMVAGHTQAIAIYRKEADDAQNPALKQYAQNALPVLQKHLDRAKELGQARPSAGQ
jgi:putative membrane protein